MSNKNTERKNIVGFVKGITNKNYATADKYLERVVEDKLKTKINSVKDINIFSDE
tara:strand:+ start:1781 stop:1945 length:165 start_codon:yes stop_codon:yes gene_type:complete